MADDLSTLVFTAASSAVITKKRGVAIIGMRIPAAVAASATRFGFEVSYDGGTTYSPIATDVAGTPTLYKPEWAVTQMTVFDPDVMHITEGARNVRVTTYATDGTTAAVQTSTTFGICYGKILRN